MGGTGCWTCSVPQTSGCFFWRGVMKIKVYFLFGCFIFLWSAEEGKLFQLKTWRRKKKKDFKAEMFVTMVPQSIVGFWWWRWRACGSAHRCGLCCPVCWCMPDVFDVETEAEKRRRLIPPVCSDSSCSLCFSFLFWSFEPNLIFLENIKEKYYTLYLKKDNLFKEDACLFFTVCTVCCFCADVVGQSHVWPLMQLFRGVVWECTNMK